MRRLLDARFASLLPITVALACGGDGSEGGADASAQAGIAATNSPMTVADVGFATPESVLHDTAADVYLVSNINGAPLDADGNGFISRLAPDGTVAELKWIDGATDGVTLHAPKGMAIDGDLLYVTDMDCVRTFDRTTGAATSEFCVEGASFLNDLVPHPEGGVLFTDTGFDPTFAPTGTDAVYRLLDGEVTPIVRDAGLGAPNGLAVRDGDPIVVTFGSGAVLQIGDDGSTEVITESVGGQFDGIEVLDDGRILVSDWATSCVQALGADGEMTCLFGDLEAPADFGVDRTRQRVLVPLFNANEVRILPIG